jgi:hypothetical protein
MRVDLGRTLTRQVETVEDLMGNVAISRWLWNVVHGALVAGAGTGDFA